MTVYGLVAACNIKTMQLHNWRSVGLGVLAGITSVWGTEGLQQATTCRDVANMRA